MCCVPSIVQPVFRDRPTAFGKPQYIIQTARAHAQCISRPSFPSPSTALLPPAKMATPVDQKLLKSTKFPPEFSRKVDMTKVNIEVMKKYSRLPRILIATQSVNSLLSVTDGLPVESLKSLAMKMTLSLNCASTSWKALAMYVSMDANTLTRFIC